MAAANRRGLGRRRTRTNVRSVEKDSSLNWLCRDCPYLADCKKIQQSAAVAA
jgi:hypothetical protein